MTMRTHNALSALLLAAMLTTRCGGNPAPAPQPPNPQPPAPTVRAVATFVRDQQLRPVVGASCQLEDNPAGVVVRVQGSPSNHDGYVLWPDITTGLRNTAIFCQAAGFADYGASAVLQSDTNEDLPGPMLARAGVDPTQFNLQQLAAIRGSMWTARLNVPYGPRPGAADNILATDFYGVYDADTKSRMLAVYRGRGYTHAVTGPVAGSDCYHGQYPCRVSLPNQQEWDAYLDDIQNWWNAGITPVYFHKPDGWETPEHAADLDALDALVRQPRAQRLLRVVVYCGWEPSGSKYGWTNATYVACLQRGAAVFPNALRALHTAADLDAPTGGNDDRTFPAGQGNVISWQRAVPYIHVWLVQLAGYINGPSEVPTAQFLQDFRAYWPDLRKRFGSGYAGWPTSSAWGVNEGVHVCYAEGASYTNYWQNWAERYSLDLGDEAMAAGADCYLDGGRVAVPVR